MLHVSHNIRVVTFQQFAGDAVVACVMGVFTAGLNRSLDLPAGRVREFAQGLGTILLHGLGLKRAEAERIMRDAIEAILPRE